MTISIQELNRCFDAVNEYFDKDNTYVKRDAINTIKMIEKLIFYFNFTLCVSSSFPNLLVNGMKISDIVHQDSAIVMNILENAKETAELMQSNIEELMSKL